MLRKSLMALALTAGLVAAQENYSTWGSMRVISVKAGITQKVTKFPLLVRLNSTHADVFANSKGRGADIRFTKSNLATRYPHQIERWDSAGQKAEIWVLVDSVNPGSVLNIKMLWNKAGAADSSKGSDVFSASNGFVSVLHLGDSTGTNPRPNQVAGAPTGILQHFNDDQPGYQPVEGVIGKADELLGGNMMANFYPGRDYIDLGRRSYAGFSDFTTGFYFSTWFNISNSVQYERFLEMNDDTAGVGQSPERIILFGNHTTAPQNVSIRWGSPDGDLTYNEPNGSLYPTGSWAHIAFSKPAGYAPIGIYVNGQLVAESDGTGDPAVALREHVVLGRPSVTQGDPFFSGRLDESIIAKVARSADWIKLSYETQRPDQGVVTLGATTAPAAGGNDYTSLSPSAAARAMGFSARSAGRQVVFGMPAAAATGRVSVIDVWGRVLWTRNVEAGATSVTWDGRGQAGTAARGVYVARFETAKGLSVERKFTYNP